MELNPDLSVFGRRLTRGDADNVDKMDEGESPGSDRELSHSPAESGEFAQPVTFMFYL
jgi:hypothetical protein